MQRGVDAVDQRHAGGGRPAQPFDPAGRAEDHHQDRVARQDERGVRDGGVVEPGHEEKLVAGVAQQPEREHRPPGPGRRADRALAGPEQEHECEARDGEAEAGEAERRDLGKRRLDDREVAPPDEHDEEHGQVGAGGAVALGGGGHRVKIAKWRVAPDPG